MKSSIVILFFTAFIAGCATTPNEAVGSPDGEKVLKAGYEIYEDL